MHRTLRRTAPARTHCPGARGGAEGAHPGRTGVESGFQKPAFVAEGIFKEVKLIGKLKNHMKGFIEDGFGTRIPFMWFFFNTEIKSGERRKFLFQIAKDDFASEKTKQLEICIHVKNIISNI